MSTPGRPSVPVPLVVATSLVALEALLLVLFGLAELRWLSAGRLAMGATTVLFFVAYGVGLGWCGWQLHRLRSWTRAPVVLSQLIQILVAWGFRGGVTTFVTPTLIGVAVVVLVGVFHPSSLRALAGPVEDADRRVD